MTKEPATQTVKSGDPASFTITVTNTGDVNLSPIAVLDYINGVKVAECSRNLTGLNVGEVDELHLFPWRRDGELYKHRRGDSLVPETGTYTMSNDSAEVTVVPWNPAIQVTKEPATQTVKPGDPAELHLHVDKHRRCGPQPDCGS